MPPRRVYKAKVALCIAGLKPIPKAPKILQAVNCRPVRAIARPKYVMISATNENFARRRSNAAASSLPLKFSLRIGAPV